MRGVYYYTFIISLETANLQNSEVFSEYIRVCYLLISSNLLKNSFRETSLFVLTMTGVLEKSVLLATYLKLFL